MSDEEFKLMFQKNCFTPKHKIGDSVYYLADHETTDDAGPFELVIREWENAVQKIIITEQGFAYGNFDSYEPFADDAGFDNEGDFWTRKEAEEYLDTLKPMIDAFKEGDTVFYKNPHSGRMCETAVIAFTFYDGNFKYDTDAGFKFEYSDIGKNFFLTKEEYQKNEKTIQTDKTI